ncbi:hypothetical protein EX895_001071 [Sporisorium graminicola]|uniref:GH16 domain-containing protein n=1 Tax=Sporisorium graminicola TaxID=280036 RepID=A0A4U7KY41_9BASI|nr:hypothetical protein EX895_001071 [Sporisorium graminicola]TKY89774.1 hypothetical protein EX895_001071 [Sporisorium graminicola]
MFRPSNGASEFRSTRVSPQQILEESTTRKKGRKDDQGDLYWTQSRAGRRSQRYGCLILLVGIIAGSLMGGMRIGLELLSYYKDQGKYCLVMEDNFDGPLNTTLWQHEVSVGGNGNGEFQWDQASPQNSYTEDGNLYIVPTLTADVIGEANIYDGYTVNLTADGTCTQKESKWTEIDRKIPMQIAINSTHTNCQAHSNATLGTVIPPVRSARLTTKGTAAIRYGRVEVRARMPTGDWLWPAVWMMPRDAVYGDWPRSGEIDIFESDGNKPTWRYDVHSNSMRSTLHFGYDPDHNLQRKWGGIRLLWRKYFNEDYHTFGLEWDEHGIWTWERSRNYRVLNKKFKNFAIDREPVQRDKNGVLIPPPNPWLLSNSKAAPFDQYFYLILNVAVGSTNGYFANSPWSNSDPNAARAFIEAKDHTWGPTWPQDPKKRGMAIDYVKMWQRCG